jgi:hypothetical protein
MPLPNRPCLPCFMLLVLAVTIGLMLARRELEVQG